MTLKKLGLIVATTVLISACSGSSDNSKPTAEGSKPVAEKKAPKQKAVKSREGYVKGNIRAGSKFSKIKLGMRSSEVYSRIGTPDDYHTHETGKRWIPFYYGSDIRRRKALYEGEGCLQFTGGNQFGGGAGKLVGITVDPSGACY